VSETLAAGETPLVLGGDHSVAIGSVVGSARDADVGVLWFDAHGDLNTPATTPSGNVHRMALAAILGLGEFADAPWANAAGVDPETVALVGVRDLDPGEREAIRDHDIAAFSISEIDDRGITAVVADPLDAARGRDGVHVSLDLDWLDPTEAPGVGTPVRGGVTYREAHAALERVAEATTVRSLELVEVNPILDDHNRTAELAVELAASALGKSIL
jgi:arginase